MRLTARGIGLLVAGAVLLIAGYAFGYPELAALGAGAIVAVAGAFGFVTWRPQLSVTRSAEPDRLMRGESSQVRLEISNASRYFGASLVALDRLRPGRDTVVEYPVPTSRRGLVIVGPLQVSRRDPLDLVRVVRRYGDE